MTKLNKAQKEAVRTLAVAYSALTEKSLAGDLTGARVWARMLIEAQSKTGVEVMPEFELQDLIRQADKQAA